MELNEIKVRLKGHSDPKAGVFFDAIFTDPEAKVLSLRIYITFSLCF